MESYMASNILLFSFNSSLLLYLYWATSFSKREKIIDCWTNSHTVEQALGLLMFAVPVAQPSGGQCRSAVSFSPDSGVIVRQSSGTHRPDAGWRKSWEDEVEWKNLRAEETIMRNNLIQDTRFNRTMALWYKRILEINFKSYLWKSGFGTWGFSPP